MTTAISIAVAQTCPAPGRVDTNIEEHVRLALLAAAEGANVVVFPELSLCGYELESADALAFEEGDERLRPLLSTASSTSTILVVGAPVRMNNMLHIGALVLYPDGRSDLYTKHRLGAFPANAAADGIVPPAEATVFQPGNRNPIVRVGAANIALAVCADIGRPLHAQNAAARGATHYLAGMFVIPSDFEVDSGLLRGYAIEHSMTVALANFGSESGGLPSAGRSSIWSGSGELIVQLGASGAGVGVATKKGTGWRARAVMLSDR